MKKERLSKLKNRAWVRLGSSSRFVWLLRIYCQLTGKNIAFVSGNTQAVIEGYPRSGNTYVYCAFVLSQPGLGESEVAHHVHGAAQIEQGVARGLPVLLLLREPEKAIPSLLIRAPNIDPADACRDYLAFHQRVLRWADSILVVGFEFAINRFPDTVSQLNKRFSTAFSVPQATPEFEAEVRAMVDRLDREDTGEEQVDAMKVGVPNEARKAASKAIGNDLQTNYPALLAECRAVYEKLIEMTDLK